MLRFLVALVVLGTFGLQDARAQEPIVYLQIQAKRTQAEALDAARAYAAEIEDVSGFRLGSNWFAITVGPYAASDAAQVLSVYRAEGVIPRDSFITQPSIYGAQFFPSDSAGNTAVTTQPLPPATGADEPQQETVASLVTTGPDETVREARQSEAALSIEEKKQLQIALEWAGTYTGAIDGLYGRGTRGAMEVWQRNNGFSPTGVLTTQQRVVLLEAYNAVLNELGVTLVRDTEAGIEVLMPKNAVSFDRRIAPFSQYVAPGDDVAKVILISQSGGQASLFGLYDILQTLEIVPSQGPRTRENRSFSITGRNESIVSETRVSVQNDEIKGFILVWPTGDEARRTRLLTEMERSFRRLPGVLPDNAGLDETQSIDLMSGLELRKPRFSRSGFFVDQRGTVVTTSEFVGSCNRITLDTDADAELVGHDVQTGIAVLKPNAALVPLGFGRFSDRVPRIQSEVAVAGYSYQGVLNAPSVTYGTLSDVRGLAGEPDLKRLAMSVFPGDAGGPVLDSTGAVVGMLQPRDGSSARQLPDDVNFAANADAIRRILNEAGLRGATSDTDVSLDPVDLNRSAQSMTVLVSCWD